MFLLTYRMNADMARKYYQQTKRDEKHFKFTSHDT